MSGRLAVRITPSQASRLADDLPRDVDPAAAGVEPAGVGRATASGASGQRTRALVGRDQPVGPSTPRTIEVVVDGWRFELEVEDTARATLRERATRDRSSGPGSGPLEVRAMIPGRVVAVGVGPGDRVRAGQTLLVVEAMKMQNELRAPRDGEISRVVVGAGETIDLNDLLVVLA